MTKVAVLPVFCRGTERVTTHTPDDVRGICSEAKQFYEMQSGGQEVLEFHVYNWFQMPLTREQWVGLEFTAGDTVVPQFQAGMGVDLAGFDHFVLLLDMAEARSGAWRPNDAGFRYLHVSAIDLDPALLAHEIGHLTGAGHGNLRTPFRDIEYGDTFCVMGGESDKHTFGQGAKESGPGMSASMLVACGWLDLDQPALATNLKLGQPDAVPVVELAPVRGAPRTTPEAPVVAWTDGQVEGQRLLLEFRARTDWDQGLPRSGSAAGWVVAHLTGSQGRSKDSVLIGAIGANAGARLELPRCVTDGRHHRGRRPPGEAGVHGADQAPLPRGRRRDLHDQRHRRPALVPPRRAR